MCVCVCVCVCVHNVRVCGHDNLKFFCLILGVVIGEEGGVRGYTIIIMSSAVGQALELWSLSSTR